MVQGVMYSLYWAPPEKLSLKSRISLAVGTIGMVLGRVPIC
jgi:hypothetical protein